MGIADQLSANVPNVGQIGVADLPVSSLKDRCEVDKAELATPRSLKEILTPMTANSPHLASELVTPEPSGNTLNENFKNGILLAPPHSKIVTISRETAISRFDSFIAKLANSHDKQNFFEQKVSTELPGCQDYYKKIKRPMWFALMREKFRNGEYRSTYDIRHDLETICSNATSFNLKMSLVFKNAQSLHRSLNKAFAAERVHLLEAVAALHPGGPLAAERDEAAAAPPPPKTKVNKTAGFVTPQTSTRSMSQARKPSVPHLPDLSKIISNPITPNFNSLTPRFTPGFHLPHPLSDDDDLPIDMHGDVSESKCFDSDSATDLDDDVVVRTKRKTLIDINTPNSLSNAQAMSSVVRVGCPSVKAVPYILDDELDKAIVKAIGKIGEFMKSHRNSFENNPIDIDDHAWRLKWLRLRLYELCCQEKRCKTHLEKTDGKIQSCKLIKENVMGDEESRLFALPNFSHNNATQAYAVHEAGREVNKQNGSIPDVPVNDLVLSDDVDLNEKALKELMEHPYFAFFLDKKLPEQKMPSKNEIDMDQNANYPARIFTALEFLEKQIFFLYKKMCHPPPPHLGHLHRHPNNFDGSVSVSRFDLNMSLSPPTYSRRQSLERGQTMSIQVPQFHEHTLEDYRERAALLKNLLDRRRKRSFAASASSPTPESSSDEDDSDAAFMALHQKEEELEKSNYDDDEAYKKKRRLKNPDTPRSVVQKLESVSTPRTDSKAVRKADLRADLAKSRLKKKVARQAGPGRGHRRHDASSNGLSARSTTVMDVTSPK